MSDFLWGAATSSHQIEGGNRHNDWWAWESEGKVEGGVRSAHACDHWNRWEEDLDLAASLSLNSYRFSVEWSRIEPEEGRWEEAAFCWYEKLLAGCEARGLKPMLTLHHFTLPQWLACKGGFSNDAAPAAFLRYVTKVAERMGARVPLWCTLNEPLVLVAGSYLARFMPPGRYDPVGASRACANLLRAHVLAYDYLHRLPTGREGPWRSEPLLVGFAHNMLDFIPDRRLNPLEFALTPLIRRLYNGAWLDAVTGRPQKFGFPGVFPMAPEVKEARGRRTTDFIGVNYYTKGIVQWRPRVRSTDRDQHVPLGVTFARRKEEVSDLEWAIHPLGLRRVLNETGRYQLPIIITENGLADHTDHLRARFIREHLRELAHGLARGLDIRGYYHWSLLDNFEWIKGFWPRFGLIGVNYETLSRSPRPSAFVYRDIIEAHGRTRPPELASLELFRTEF